MKKENIVKELIIIFWLFIIGSILGYIFEMIVVLFQKGYFESRQGLIYGPFTPVYGIGAIIYYLVLNKVKTRNKLKIFFITMILGGATEYISSFIEPLIEKLRLIIDTKSLKIITIFVSIFMIFNIQISCFAADRQFERRKNIEPENRLDMFLDKYYPDEYMNQIFTNKKDV